MMNTRILLIKVINFFGKQYLAICFFRKEVFELCNQASINDIVIM